MSHYRNSRVPRHGRSAAAAAATLGLVIAAGTLMTACTNADFAHPGPAMSEQRPVDGVHSVNLRTSGDLTITTGPTAKLTITADRMSLRYLTSTLHDGTVVLDSRSGHLTSGDIHYALTLPSLDRLEVAGSGSAHGTVVAAGSFAVTVSGSGSAALEGLAATGVTVQLSGSGDIHLAGTTAVQTVQLGGSGNYLGMDLTSRTSNVQVDGSGNVEVNATQRLDAEIAGSGNIDYTGSPALSTDVSGNGTVRAG